MLKNSVEARSGRSEAAMGINFLLPNARKVGNLEAQDSKHR
jgi:hypothetical protein